MNSEDKNISLKKSVLLSSQSPPLILAALRFARAILCFSGPKSLRSKHRRTIKNENFILSQFEDVKIVSRLVEILELGHLETLKVAAFEIITKIAATSNSSKILDVVGQGYIFEN